MLDRPPVLDDSPLHRPASYPTASEPPAAAPGTIPPWLRPTAPDVAVGEPTLVALEVGRGGRAVWLKRGLGLSGMVLLAIVGWTLLRHEPPHAPLPTVVPPTTPAIDPAPPPQEAASTPPAAAPAPATADAASPPDPVPPAPAIAPSPDISLPPATSASIPPESGAAAPGPVAAPDEHDIEKPHLAETYEATARLEAGDNLASLLGDLYFAPDDINAAVAALAPHLKLRRMPVGQTMTLVVETSDDIDVRPVLKSLTIRPEARRQVILERRDDGTFDVREERFELVAKLVRAAGDVDGSLIGSALDVGVPRAALAEMVRAFSWDVNFQHDMKVGDKFAVLIEQSWTTDGKLVDSGRVLWAQVTTDAGRKTYSVYRFKPSHGREFFYYGNGRSVVKSLLRTPLSLSRISSRFGLRRHPILGYTAMHKGIDFSAPAGTPVLAAGAGQVAQAGRNGGYGRWIKILHGRGLATGYAHLARIARGIRRGVRVRQGQVIGFVGSSGLSTGPHLHFELHRNGQPVNPLSVARTALRAGLAGADLVRFRAAVARIDRARDSAEIIASR